MIYLAHAIDKNKNTGARIDRVIGELRVAGITSAVFVPSSAFVVIPDKISDIDVQAIVRTNYQAMKESLAVLVDYQPGVESWGVPQELGFAAKLKKPILVVTSELGYNQMSVYLRAWIKEEDLFPSWKLAATRLKEMGYG